MLDPYLGTLTLNQINGDVIWSVVEGELKKGNKPATVNRYLALVRSLLRMARDEWQWIDSTPKIRLLPGEVERDRWLTREEADRLIQACPPHLAAVVKFAPVQISQLEIDIAFAPLRSWASKNICGA